MKPYVHSNAAREMEWFVGSRTWPGRSSGAIRLLLVFRSVLIWKKAVKLDRTEKCVGCLVQKICMALIWLQTMMWSFMLVGAAGLSVYCWFENPEPWAAIGRIWAVAGGLTGAVLVFALLLNGLGSLARKARGYARNPSPSS